jgi:hypothetical protein
MGRDRTGNALGTARRDVVVLYAEAIAVARSARADSGADGVPRDGFGMLQQFTLTPPNRKSSWPLGWTCQDSHAVPASTNIRGDDVGKHTCSRWKRGFCTIPRSTTAGTSRRPVGPRFRA